MYNSDTGGRGWVNGRKEERGVRWWCWEVEGGGRYVYIRWGVNRDSHARTEYSSIQGCSFS